MAKKSITENSGSKQKLNLFNLIKKVDNSVELVKNSVLSKSDYYVPLGSYILQATVSGSIFKGLLGGRCHFLAGPSGCGKSFLACSICREAQNLDYDTIYIDTEAAITEDFVSRLGVDPNRLMIRNANTVAEVMNFILSTCQAVIDAKKEGQEVNPIVMVLDSIGNLAGSHEKEVVLNLDLNKDADKIDKLPADFGRTKDLKKMFRLITVPLAQAGITLVAINHTYAQIGAYVPGEVMSGGTAAKYASTTTLFMSASKLEDKENDKNAEKKVLGTVKKTGVKIKCKIEKSRMVIPHSDIELHLPFYKPLNPYIGLEKFLNWENSGVSVGKCFTEEEYQKLKPAEQTECEQFEYINKDTGEVSNRYAMHKKAMTRGVGIICKHLGQAVSVQDFFSPIVFTDEFLHFIDDTIIKPEFELPSRDSFDDIDDIKNELGIEDDEND